MFNDLKNSLFHVQNRNRDDTFADIHAATKLFSDRLHEVAHWQYISLAVTMVLFNERCFLDLPCQHSLWEVTEVPGENPRLTTERPRTHCLQTEWLPFKITCTRQLHLTLLMLKQCRCFVLAVWLIS